MADLRDIMGYICSKYPCKNDLSKAKLNKIIYLADWKSCISGKNQISPIEWIYNNYGPYVNDVEMTALFDDEFFKIHRTCNMYGNTKEVICLKKEFDYQLSQEEQETIDFVISKVASLNWDRFIKLVYSTYPIMTSAKHEKLNLENLAERYNAQKAANII